MRKNILNNNELENLESQDLESQWLDLIEEEGQLSVDVYQQDKNIVVKSTIAGANPEDIEIAIHGDSLTIKGSRTMTEEVDYKDYLYRECYWGKFSRTIILPTAIQEDKVKADMKNGVLTVTLPLAKQAEHQIKVKQK